MLRNSAAAPAQPLTGALLPTWVEIGTFVGSFGLFFTLFLLFCRFVPMVAMAEVKSVLPPGEAAGVGAPRAGGHATEPETVGAGGAR